jgi:hypothetical protein
MRRRQTANEGGGSQAHGGGLTVVIVLQGEGSIGSST